MISVCMATYNGERFIHEQLQSILHQLSPEDEVIISDDGSTDDTLNIIASLNDPRIKTLKSSARNVVRNFENALSRANGDYIFLADQDDIWVSGKVKACLSELHSGAQLVVTDCSLIDEDGHEIAPSYFALRKPRKTILKNLARNSFIGCCMAFSQKVLLRSLPFPPKIPMHDSWIGLMALTIGEVTWLDTPFVKYRRHQSAASQTAQKSTRPISLRLKDRLILSKNLAVRTLTWR